MTHHDIREEKIDTLNELISVTRDSAKFYGEAAGEAKNPQLQSLFRSMADSKNGIVGALSREVRSEGAEPKESGSFSGSLHRLYGEVRGKLGSDDYTYVSQLEESEDRMLHAYRDVLKDDDTPQTVKSVVSEYLPKVQAQHDLMRDRKWAMQASDRAH
ncbi:MAG TPA: PA2169 family four-helix-bundle protein [Xanthomonadaceae bacterium]|nr:PA2169 family four-helix-bundle protein [Xanthomonadaceae bacterium]